MPKARYKQVVDAFAARIRAGALRPGTRLPTHRELANRRGLALATATRVYAELEAMGLVTGETGRGTFVRETAMPKGLGIDQVVVADDMVDLTFNYPSVPGQGELLRAALRRLAASGDLDALLRYQPHGGRSLERETVAAHVREQGLPATADRLLIVDGAQHGLAVTGLALLKPGDVVAIDALTYPGMKAVAQSLRLELAPVPAAGAGPDLDALATLCRHRKVKAAYVQPTVHNPLGWVMTADLRARLAAVAQKHGVLLVEDSPYAFLESHPQDSLLGLAPELTVHVSGFSKNVATGLRVGYLVAPPKWIPSLERSIRATTWNTPGVMTALVCGWIKDGTVHRLERQKREDARRRQALVAEAFRGLPYASHPTSYFVWLPLEPGVRADRLASDLRKHRISVSTAEPFATTPQVPHAVRLALGSVSLAALQSALTTVRALADEHACR